MDNLANPYCCRAPLTPLNGICPVRAIYDPRPSSLDALVSTEVGPCMETFPQFRVIKGTFVPAAVIPGNRCPGTVKAIDEMFHISVTVIFQIQRNNRIPAQYQRKALSGCFGNVKCFSFGFRWRDFAYDPGVREYRSQLHPEKRVRKSQFLRHHGYYNNSLALLLGEAAVMSLLRKW